MHIVVQTLYAVSISGALVLGSIAYYNPDASKRWEGSTALSARLTQNAVALERYRRDRGGALDVAGLTDLPGQIGPFGGDFSKLGLAGETWSVGMSGPTPALCFAATADDTSAAAMQGALSRLNHGFVSNACGVVTAPATGVRFYTIILRGEG